MTPRQRKEAEKFMQEWICKLKITHWHIDLHWIKKGEKDEGPQDAAAWISRQEDYQRAYITVREHAYVETLKDKGISRANSYILHELIHIVLADYDHIVTARYLTESEFDTIRERTTEHLTKIFRDLCTTKASTNSSPRHPLKKKAKSLRKQPKKRTKHKGKR